MIVAIPLIILAGAAILTGAFFLGRWIAVLTKSPINKKLVAFLGVIGFLCGLIIPSVIIKIQISLYSETEKMLMADQITMRIYISCILGIIIGTVGLPLLVSLLKKKKEQEKLSQNQKD